MSRRISNFHFGHNASEGTLTRWAALGLIIILLGAIYISQFVSNRICNADVALMEFRAVGSWGCLILAAFELVLGQLITTGEKTS
jgi:uncharacterized membrane protein YphA (DoxX/SURF4 family)